MVTWKHMDFYLNSGTMKINSQTKISSLIKYNPEAIDAIASVNSHFNKLKNPILRRVLASRVTIKDAAAIGKCSVSDIMNVLVPIGFEPEAESGDLPGTETRGGETSTSWEVQPDRVKILDVRPVLETGADPFNLIMQELKDLPEGYALEIINSFEPTPLIRILGMRGYKSYSRQEQGAVHTRFMNVSANPAMISDELPVVPGDELEIRKREFEGRVREIDVRSLEMPLPMMTILEALEMLPEAHALYVYHIQVPRFLLPELEERNFRVLISELSEGDVRLLITR